MLISTHDLDLAFQVSDRLWLATKKGITAGCPEDLILNGEIERTFASENFRFEKATGKFKKNIFHTKSINLTGNGISYFWTKNALERIGFAIHPENESLKLAVTNLSKNHQWKLEVKGKTYTFSLLDELLIFLRNR